MIGCNHGPNALLNPHGHLNLLLYHDLPRKVIEAYLFSAVADFRAVLSGHRLTLGEAVAAILCE